MVALLNPQVGMRTLDSAQGCGRPRVCVAQIASLDKDGMHCVVMPHRVLFRGASEKAPCTTICLKP
ncbi:MAG: hypothetical protein ACI8WM_002504 [Burkholderiaceae bacterium]|jgi:hypothetical protein